MNQAQTLNVSGEDYCDVDAIFMGMTTDQVREMAGLLSENPGHPVTIMHEGRELVLEGDASKAYCAALVTAIRAFDREQARQGAKVFELVEVGENAAPGDPVNHPTHYTSHPSGIECIEITQHMGFNLGNATKYIWRADLKNDAIEDLRKARWYVDRELGKRGALDE